MFETAGAIAELRRLAETSADGASDDDLCGAVLGLEQARSLLDAAEGHLLAELERRGTAADQFGLTTGGWLAHHANLPPGVAKARVRRACHVVRSFPTIDQAVVDGAVTSEHAALLANLTNARVRDAVADVQDELVALAQELTFEQWRAHVRRLIALLDQDGAEPDEARNRLRFAESLDGMTYLDGAMTADLALVLRTAVEARADELHLRAVRDHRTAPELDVPSRATLRMQALVELVRGEGDDAGRAEVTLVLHDHETTDERGHPVPRAAAGVWGCEPDLWAVVVDHMGQPLDVGRTKRVPTPFQRKAVAVRDGGCAFPGCDQPMARCDIHHLVPWDHGGRTDLDNLCALCRRHHTITHRRGWTLRTTGDGQLAWTTPNGRVLTNTDRAPPGRLAA